MEMETVVKYGISVNHTSTGKVGFWATVETTGLSEQEALTLSDSLMAKLSDRYVGAE
jgi:hypothetical protein